MKNTFFHAPQWMTECFGEPVFPITGPSFYGQVVDNFLGAAEEMQVVWHEHEVTDQPSHGVLAPDFHKDLHHLVLGHPSDGSLVGQDGAPQDEGHVRREDNPFGGTSTPDDGAISGLVIGYGDLEGGKFPPLNQASAFRTDLNK